MWSFEAILKFSFYNKITEIKERIWVIEMKNLELKYLKLLSTKFRNISETTIEIINLQAILNLPKGTEHFLTDIHGEYDAFHHVLKNGSGTIKEKINDIFKDELSNYDKKELASVIYYPTKKVDI